MQNSIDNKLPPVSQEYQNWRELIFSHQPARPLRGVPDEVYGILMDVGMGDGRDQYLAISMYVLDTGEASLKASTGSGVAGLGDIKELAGLPQYMLQLGQSLLSWTVPVKNLDYPEPNRVYFYFLTTSGIRVCKCGLNDLKNGHPLYEMFFRFSTIKSFADKIMDDQRNRAA